uniref:Uncharacterized protein n=1 Tax=Rhizophora mucronata TaxID=61149 RepID=A0A2P2P515_RHIMU
MQKCLTRTLVAWQLRLQKFQNKFEAKSSKSTIMYRINQTSKSSH